MITQEIILDTLLKATSQQFIELKLAEKLLSEWETKPGFYSVLLQVISNYNLQPTVRWMAALTFKNGVDRYWRKTAPNAISEEEKQSLRCGLMRTLAEPVNQVAVQLAVLIAKIARFDYPREWPELLPSLVDFVLKGEEPLTQHRALVVLQHVIKTLASKRLAGDRKVFHDVTSQLYSYILNLSNSGFENFFSQVQSNDPQSQATLEKALITIQIIRKLTVHGFKQPSDSAEVKVFVSSVFDRIRNLLHIRKTLDRSNAENMVELIEKTICRLMKVHLSLLEIHPYSFVPYIQSSLSFTVSMLFSSQGEGLLFPRFVIQSMNLTKGILLCAEYLVSKSVDEKPPLPVVTEANMIKADFFKPDVLREIINALISRYLPLTQEELELWDSDPEEFECDEAGESWKYTLRASTEALFMSIYRSYRTVLVPVLVQLVHSHHLPVSPHDLPAVLRKDAVYLAVGLAAFDLYDDVDMNLWFNGLLTELSIKEGHYRIIRRRVAWLLGVWCGVRLSNDLRPALYRSFLALLHADEDMAVRLTAADALKQSIDDFDFDSSQFMDLLETFVSHLFGLLREVKECDTKMHVLNVLSYIVERVGVAIKPYSNSLMQYLPLMWAESSNHNMLRCAIVSTLVHCVRALVTDEISSFMYPVLEVCLDMSQPPSMYLMEDGLELWLAVLEYSHNLSPSMMHLLKFMPNILETSTEHMQHCCLIIQAYVLLSPSLFFTEYGDRIFSCCYELINDVKPQGLVLIYNVIDLCMRVDTAIMLQMAMPIIHEVFLRIYEDKDYPMVLSAVLPIMAKILLHSQDMFCHVVGLLAQSKNETAEVALHHILGIWADRMALINNNTKQKQLALALTSIMTADSPAVLDRVPAIIRSVVQALNDIMDIGDDNQKIDTLMLLNDVQDEIISLTEHERRLKKLDETDPVFKINLQNYFTTQMEQLGKKIGNTRLDRIISSLDSDTLDGIKLYLVPSL